MEKIVSIVIPIYNVEQYIHRCINSVLCQTYRNLEVILVDDGSNDSSPEICDNYKKKDSRIIVIHKANGGLASARNAGMRKMTGDYLFFLDSDDWLEPNGIERLVKVAEKYNVDFVRFRSIRSCWPGKEEHVPCYVESIRELTEGYFDADRIKSEIYPRLIATPQLTMGPIVGAWGSLYRVSFIKDNNLYFDEKIRFSEDQFFSVKIVRAAKSFYFVDSPGTYHYFYNPNSISKSFRSGRWDSSKACISACESEFLNDKGYDFTNQLNWLRWFHILLSLKEKKNIVSLKERMQYCKKIILDPVTKNTRINADKLNVSHKQKIILRLIKLRTYWLFAFFE